MEAKPPPAYSPSNATPDTCLEAQLFASIRDSEQGKQMATSDILDLMFGLRVRK